MSAESGLEAELEAGLDCDDFTLAHPVLRRRHSEPQLAHHPSASGWDLSMPSLHAGTEFLNKDPLWVIAVWKQYQESEERTGLTIPGLQTAMIIVTLTEWLTVGATSVLHKDQKTRAVIHKPSCSCRKQALQMWDYCHHRGHHCAAWCRGCLRYQQSWDPFGSQHLNGRHYVGSLAHPQLLHISQDSLLSTDINECLIQGLCKDAECMNTRGSFRCTCKPGSMLDPSRSHCVCKCSREPLGLGRALSRTPWLSGSHSMLHISFECT